MRPIIDWFKWEFDRRIEVTPAITLIILDRFAHMVVLIAAGIALLVLGTTSSFHQYVLNLQDQLNLSPGQSWWRHVYEDAVVRFGLLSRGKQDAIAAGAMLYGALEGIEGAGLMWRRRWAEYLVLLATAAFLPLEITEIVHKPTPIKALALLVNLAIIGYLIWRKRLFLDRPGREVSKADETGSVPARRQSRQ